MNRSQPMQADRTKTHCSLNAKQYRDQRRLPALDGLRGLAVALVVTCHLHNRMWGGISGYVGVTIFFVLSGYLITRLALLEERKEGRLNLSAFFVRRFFRIFPLYYFFLGVYCLMLLKLRLWPDKIASFRQSLPYYLLYFQEIPFWKGHAGAQGPPPFYHTWSLGIEEKFYLVWPFLFVLAGFLSRIKLRCLIAVLGMAVCLVQGFLMDNTASYNLQSYGFILMGILVALILDHKATYDRARRLFRLGFLPAVTGLLVLQFYLLPYHPWRGWTTLYALFASVLLGFLVTSENTATRIFSLHPLTFLGKLSYGVYLCHILALGLVERFAHPDAGKAIGIVAYLGTIAVSVCTALLTFYGLEQPMIRIGHRLSKRLLDRARSRNATNDVTLCKSEGTGANDLMQSYSLCGMRLDGITRSELMHRIASARKRKSKLLILNHNLHSMYLYTKQQAFRDAYELASCVYVDGMPVVWLARFAGVPLEESHRITFLDCLEDLLRTAATNQWRVYYLGSDPGTLRDGLAILRERYPDLILEGEHGYLGPNFVRAPEAIARLNAFRPDIVFVGMGMPLQEKFIHDYLHDIQATAILTSGATLDYTTGKAYKPPAWAGPLGLYGIFRMFSDPKRLWKRYLIEPVLLLVAIGIPLLQQRRTARIATLR